ncbi:hypothetical protein MCHUDSM44219_00118 [Mycolicibacterium chubuense]|uniref:Uncharacterized protein n=1 Tax=Mycolicibacterium chubuense TaxID=1800 RepID=A0A0J6WNK5_MYCCU|nr:hypothetical protein [Mycolicibacterium chubuense]KMO84975.1 hypothetical protein MCHUDSM44219_00118 [Mycolicibacterium chubuense]
MAARRTGRLAAALCAVLLMAGCDAPPSEPAPPPPPVPQSSAVAPQSNAVPLPAARFQ